MQRTPLASGGTSIESMTTGGRSTPSIRGIENPQTSASTTATSLPRCARAMARLVVTDDLPTPPLPRSRPAGRGSSTTGRRTGWLGPRRGRGPAGSRPWPRGRRGASPEGLALFVGHRGELDPGRRHTGQLTDGFGDPPGDLALERAAGNGERHEDLDGLAVDAHLTHHVEVDDAAMELGIFDGPEGLDDLGFGDGHVRSSAIGNRSSAPGNFSYRRR